VFELDQLCGLPLFSGDVSEHVCTVLIGQSVDSEGWEIQSRVPADESDALSTPPFM